MRKIIDNEDPREKIERKVSEEGFCPLSINEVDNINLEKDLSF